MICRSCLREELSQCPYAQARGQAKALLSAKFPVSLATLETSLQAYLAKPTAIQGGAFSLQKNLVVSPEDTKEKAPAKGDAKSEGKLPEGKTPAGGAGDEKKALTGMIRLLAFSAGFVDSTVVYLLRLQVRPRSTRTWSSSTRSPNSPRLAPFSRSVSCFKSHFCTFMLMILACVFVRWLGCLQSCAPVELTEKETEYVVSCIKHIYPRHVVFQFNVTNNVEDQQLEDVTVEMAAEEDEWSEEMAVPEEKLVYQQPGVTFVAFARPKTEFTATLKCKLKFTVKDVNNGEVSTSGHEVPNPGSFSLLCCLPCK